MESSTPKMEVWLPVWQLIKKDPETQSAESQVPSNQGWIVKQ